MGLLVYFLHFKRADLLAELAHRCMHSWGKMGTETKRVPIKVGPSLLRCRKPEYGILPGLFASAGLLGLCSRQARLAKLLSFFPQAYSTAPGYVSHLTLLHLYLNRRILGTSYKAGVGYL